MTYTPPSAPPHPPGNGAPAYSGLAYDPGADDPGADDGGYVDDFDDFDDYGATAAEVAQRARTAARGRGRQVPAVYTPQPPRGFSLQGGTLAINPWWALGLLLLAAGVGVYVERRYKLTSRVEGKVRDEVDDTKRKYVATKRAVGQTAKDARRKLAKRVYRRISGEDAEGEEG
jgi:hypothetical protein